MSKQNMVLNTGRQAIINNDTPKVFIWGNRYTNADLLNNSGYNPEVLYKGTVLGRVTATNRLAPFNAAASDGTQFPVGVLAESISVDSGAVVQPYYCTFGDVNSGELIFPTPNQGLDSIITGQGRVRDVLRRVGINPVDGTSENTRYDNQ